METPDLRELSNTQFLEYVDQLFTERIADDNHLRSLIYAVIRTEAHQEGVFIDMEKCTCPIEPRGATNHGHLPGCPAVTPDVEMDTTVLLFENETAGWEYVKSQTPREEVKWFMLWADTQFLVHTS